MKRHHWILAAVIAVEAVAGAALLMHARSRAVPPEADLTLIDPLTAPRLAALREECRVPADWVKLAEAYQAFGYFAESEACYRHASNSEPGRGDWAFAWAFALERLALLEQANAQYERAARLGHQPGSCWYFIGRNHLRLEDARAARQAFEKAEGQSGARLERARLLAREGERGGALALLDLLPPADRETIQPSQLRHRLEALAGGPGFAATADRASRARSRLLTPFDVEAARLEEFAPQYTGPNAEFKAARELLEAGKHEEAAGRLREALERHWESGLADLLAEAELEGGHSAEAVARLEDVVARIGPSVHNLTRLGAAHYRAGRADEAARHWQRATELGFGGAVRNLHYKLAEYHEGKKNTARARAHFAQAHFGLGHEAFWNRDFNSAAAALTKAAEYDPNLAAAEFYLGEMYRMVGRAEEARKHYERCLKIDPDHGRAHTGLSLLGKK